MSAKAEALKTKGSTWIAWAVITIGTLILVIAFAKALQMNWALRSELAKVEPVLKAAHTEQAELQRQLAYVQSDEYVARWSQVHARMTQSNETLIIPVQATPAATATPTVPPTPAPAISEPFFFKWLRRLTGN